METAEPPARCAFSIFGLAKNASLGRRICVYQSWHDQNEVQASTQREHRSKKYEVILSG